MRGRALDASPDAPRRLLPAGAESIHVAGSG
jgi:hypothetical protein